MPPTRFARVKGQWRGREREFRSDRLFVSVREGFPVEQTLEAVALHLQREFGAAPTYLHRPGRSWATFQFLSRDDAAERLPLLAAEIAAQPGIASVEPSFLGRIHLHPTDGKYINQTWPGVIQLESAWDLTTGSGTILLAVIDSGISILAGGTDPTHPDLNGTRFIVRHDSSPSVPVLHDIVGDDYYVGATLVDLPPDNVPRDSHSEGHGTHVTGVAAAPGNSGAGIAGVNWQSPVYIARIVDDDGYFSTEDLLDAVKDILEYATGRHNCVAINISMGINEEDEKLVLMCKAVEAFTGRALLSVAIGARGLSRTDVDYPGAYAATKPYVIAVSSTKDDDTVVDQGLDNYDAVTIFAPGYEVYSTLPTYPRTGGAAINYGKLSGTSMAAPMVSGVASLMWSLDETLTAEQIRTRIRVTADAITYTRKTRNASDVVTSTDPNAGHLRLNAAKAVASTQWSVALANSYLVFAGTPVGDDPTQAFAFHVVCDRTLTFNVSIDAPAPAALTIPTGTFTYQPADGTDFSTIAVIYRPTVAGDISAAEFKIQCVETVQEWTVSVTASAEMDTGVAVAMVTDRSGSMADPSGIDTMSRMAVLQESVGILVETVRVGDEVGVVGFASTADVPVALTGITGVSPASPERNAIKNGVAALLTGGTTSIGAGVERASVVLGGSARPLRGIIVLTDGHENTEPMIADVMAGIGVPTHAIGMGTPEVLQTDTLEALTTTTGGSLTLTGILDDASRYKVAKYVLQMLINIEGGSVVLDPVGALAPGDEIAIPFALCSDDRACQVSLMTPWPRVVRVALRTPGGNVLPEMSPAVVRVVGKHMTCLRTEMPLAGEHAGTWHALVSLEGDVHSRFLHEHGPLADAVRRGSVPYNLIVSTTSSVRMHCRAIASSSRPGAAVTLRAILLSRGRPLLTRVVVEASVRNGRHGDRIVLTPSGPGIYSTTFVASQPGVYECLVRASGLTERDELFSREHAVTAQTWYPTARDDAADRSRAHDLKSRS